MSRNYQSYPEMFPHMAASDPYYQDHVHYARKNSIKDEIALIERQTAQVKAAREEIEKPWPGVLPAKSNWYSVVEIKTREDLPVVLIVEQNQIGFAVVELGARL